MSAITFFTAANRDYEPFVIPYIFSALLFNEDARVEICLESPRAFERNNPDAIDILESRFPGKILLRRAIFQGRLPNSVRFFEAPYERTAYTYIGDIDILILEDIRPSHLRHMGRTGLPYSNILRPSGDRLSGLHFTQTEAFYPIEAPANWNSLTGNDEELLYHLVVARGHKLPDRKDGDRPLHGFHFSLRRYPTAEMGWGLYPVYLENYFKLRSDPAWSALLPYLHPLYRVCLLMADAALHAKYQDKFDPGPSLKLLHFFDAYGRR